MQPAQDGILKRCRGFAALLVALIGTFAAASRHDDATPGGTVTSADYNGRIDDLQNLLLRARLDADAEDVNRANVDDGAADDNVIEAFDVGINATLLILPVMIDGQNWWFLVDTGCGETALDTEVAIHVGLIDRHDPRLAETRQGTCRTLHAYIGKSRIPVNCRARWFDLSHLRERLNAFPLCGILGMDFLRSHVIGIDLDTGKLLFLKSVPEYSGSQLKLSRDSYDCPTLSVEIAKRSALWFLVDTGCVGSQAGAIEGSAFNELLEQNHLTSVRSGVAIMTFRGAVECHQARLDRLQVGSFEHTGLEFLEDSSVNLLGLSYLARYLVTFDFPNDSVYLKEGKRFADPARPPESHFNVGRADGIDRSAVQRFPLQNYDGFR